MVLERELNIINNLNVDTLISINISKPIDIVINLDTNIIKINLYKKILVPINIISLGKPTSTTVFSSCNGYSIDISSVLLEY